MTARGVAPQRGHAFCFFAPRFLSGRWTPAVGLLLLAALPIGCRGPSERVAEPPGVAGGVQAGAGGADWFVERAAASGLDFVHVNGMTGSFLYPEVIPPGVAVLDFDGDGDLDVFVAQGHSLDRAAPAGHAGGALFRNDGPSPLRFTQVARTSGLDVDGYGMGAAAGDFDNDGCIDLYVTKFGGSQLFRNGCDATFSDVTGTSGAGSPGWSVSAAFVDVDRDGWLDLFVAHYLAYAVAANRTCYSLSGQTDYCPPHVYRAQPSRLLRNNRDGTFTDITAAAGMATTFGPALGVATADFDGDGWMDIYVANDGTPNHLWINQRNSTFRETALLAGAAVSPEGLAKASMGVDAGDADNDGDEDLFITELTGQGADFYVNDGAASFADEGPRSGLRIATLPFTGFGAAWLDFDNDGLLDLAAVNGAVTHTAEALARKAPFALQQRRLLFRNTGARAAAGGSAPTRFEDVSDRAGAAFRAEEVGRGAAFGDLDNDGDTDIVAANGNGPLRLLVNTVGSRLAWAGLRLVARGTRRDALGARVRITRGDGMVLWRRVRADGSYASANDPRVLAGLGTAAGPVDVLVRWPDGAVEEWRGVPAGRYTTLTQGSGTAAAESRFR